jgi:signal transduction histidine kinase
LFSRETAAARFAKLDLLISRRDLRASHADSPPMNLRAKLFPALLITCVACLVALAFVQYRRSVRAAEDGLRADAEWRAAQFARAVESQRAARVREFDDLERSAPVREFFFHEGRLTPAQAHDAALVATPLSPIDAPEASVAREVRQEVESFFARSGDDYIAVTLVAGAGKGVVVRMEPPRGASGEIVVRTGEFALGVNGAKGLLAEADEAHAERGSNKWTITPQGTFAYAKRIVWEPEGPMGTCIVEAKLDALVGHAAEGFTDAGGGGGANARPFQLVALDRAGRIVYHTNPALKFQTIAGAMPYFGAVASEMTADTGGAREFVGADGARWIAAYQPVADLDLSVAVAASETAATAGARRSGLTSVALSVALSLAVAALVIVREMRAARRIERVARAARAVAGGDLDGRLDVSLHDRTRPIAESFNLMTDRLREHIRRETENRQFQAFTRLSAMLTHDLKNAITGLSMLVANMERQWEREEFRADAVTSLREATDKLRGLVARLSKPVETLSGEYRRTLRPVDLVPVIRRVLDATAARSSFHEVETDLPGSLEASVDADRVASVVENLVVNALEAMGAKPGRLTVAAGREGADQIFITVADTGAGMSAEFVRAKLFQPFATTKKQGLGLGLYTCREVVEAHGGRLTVESEPGSGTRFRVVLPSRPVSLPRSANGSSNPASN